MKAMSFAKNYIVKEQSLQVYQEKILQEYPFWENYHF